MSPNTLSLVARDPLTNPESIEPTNNRPHAPICTLNGDVLLNIFHLYRLADPDEYEDECGELTMEWYRQRWWYKLAHVCRLWRNLILGSPSRLDLHLFCTKGVPVADMLAHSPPLPLTIHYHHINREITAEDESGILLALSRHRDRVQNIFIWMPTINLRKLIMAMDGQFPILERMHINSRTDVVFPITFQAPNLRHVVLWTASVPIRSPLLTTTASLVSLQLTDISLSSYFPPSYLLTRLPLMLQLEKFTIGFRSPVPKRDVERHTPNMTRVTLPNLRWFRFQGTSAYLESLVARISAPSLCMLRVHLSNQLSFTIPRLLQFMQTSENVNFSTVKLTFNNSFVHCMADPWRKTPPLQLQITCRHLDWQVASAAQILGTLLPALSVVEEVTLIHKKHSQSSEWHSDVDRTQWRELLRPFSNAKILHVQDELVGKISRSLQSDDGELPLELLPNLKELGYSGGSDTRNAFTTFIDERQVAGCPVNLTTVDSLVFG